MAKSLTVSQDAAIAADLHAECLLIEVDLSSGVQRYTTAGTTLPAARFDPGSRGLDWIGGVNPGAIAAVRETEQSEAVGLQLRLSGVPSSQRALVLNEHIQSRRLTIWLAPMTLDAFQFIDTPVKEFEGLLDTMTLDYADDGTITITVDVESKMARMLRPNLRRYTDRDHQQRFPGDTIMRFTSQTERTVVWPSANYFAR